MNQSILKFAPGYELEAKDFHEQWHVVKVVETDWNEREVLIHFENSSLKTDEWIPMDSSRLRDVQSRTKDLKNLEFAVGDRVLAPWIDKKKYPAKITSLVSKDKYSVLFDDGFTKNVKKVSLSKLPQNFTAAGEEENAFVKSNQERRDKKGRSNLSKIPLSDRKKENEKSYLVKTGIYNYRENITNKEENVAFIGSIRVEMENGSYKCPLDECNKIFRKENLLHMHIKYYHPSFAKLLGSTPKVADLAYARTVGDSIEDFIPERASAQQLIQSSQEIPPSPSSSHTSDTNSSQVEADLKQENNDSMDESNTSPLLPETLFNMRLKEEKNYTGIKTLLPVRYISTPKTHEVGQLQNTNEKKKRLQNLSNLENKFKKFKKVQIDLEGSSDNCENNLLIVDDSSNLSFEYNNSTNNYRLEADNNDSIQSENNSVTAKSEETIELEHLSKDEIVNCKCGFYEENGLMVQCELCLCWQHGECNNIEKEDDVPENYVCYICKHPRKGRKSKKYFYDQQWINKGILPSICTYATNNKRTAMLKRSFDLISALLQIQDLFYSLRVKLNVLQSKDHPKLYLWAKNWSKIKIPIFKDDPVPVITKAEKNDDSPERDKKENQELTLTDKNKGNEKPIISDNELMNILEGDKNEAEEINGIELTTKYNTIASSKIFQPIIPEPEALIDPIECKLRLLEHFDHYLDYIESILHFVETHVTDLENMEISKKYDTKHEKQSKENIKSLFNDLETIRKLASLVHNDIDNRINDNQI